MALRWQYALLLALPIYYVLVSIWFPSSRDFLVGKLPRKRVFAPDWTRLRNPPKLRVACPAGYSPLDNVGSDVPGYGLGLTRVGLTVSQCASKCDDNLNCGAFEWCTSCNGAMSECVQYSFADVFSSDQRVSWGDRLFCMKDTEPEEEMTMWPLLKEGQFKCHNTCKEDGCFAVAGQAECQRWAMESNHPFYSYRPSDGMCTTSNACSNPIAAKTDWYSFRADSPDLGRDWLDDGLDGRPIDDLELWGPVVQGDYKCHSRCDTDGCVAASSQGECQNLALANDHSFYSYRPSDGACSSSPSCDHPLPAKSDWRAFSEMVQTPEFQESHTWTQVMDGNYKCHHTCEEDGCLTVESQEECQQLAVSNGHKFYSYRPTDRRCTTSSTCTQPMATKVDWHAYRADGQTARQLGNEVEMWAQVKEGNYKCHHTCDQDGCVYVGSQAECQGRALALGHKFYSYRAGDKRCTTSSTCNQLTQAQGGVDWQAFQADSANAGDVTVWAQVRDGNYKCHHTCEQDGCVTVGGQTECLGLAQARGHKFYSYRPPDRQCATSFTCNSPTATRVDWHAFQALWAPVKEGRIKCHSTCARDECIPAASQADCQSRAKSAGFKFYSYRPFDHMCTISDDCTMLSTKVEWHAFQSLWGHLTYGKFKCHSTCEDAECFTVANQGECQAAAAAQGDAIYSYRPSDRRCSSQSSCENPTPTSSDWHVFSKDSPTDEDNPMWAQVEGGHYKCHHTCSQDGCIDVSDQAECQGIAASRGHQFYSFRPADRKCATSQTCDRPSATRVDWRTFYSDQVSAPRALSHLWPELSGGGNYKCHHTCEEDGCVVVANRAACQGVATGKGHKFYSFRDGDGKCATSAHCDAPTASRTEWHSFHSEDEAGAPGGRKWTPVNKGEWPWYKCHTTCSQDGCITVTNQAECQSRAMIKGHRYFSYRPSDKRCATSSTCDRPTQAIKADWHIFQNEGQEHMWVQVKDGNFKCHGTCEQNGCGNAANQQQCQSIAIMKGHPFFSFRPSDGRCSTMATCKHLIASSSDWHAYKSLIAAPQNEEVTVWAAVKDGSYKCHQTCKGDGCVQAAGQADCMNRAVAVGHKFYSYRQFDKRCTTSSTCDEPNPSRSGWRAFQTLWKQVKDGSYKCHLDCVQDGCMTVDGQAACQHRAVDAGHDFYSYRSHDRLCATSKTCNHLSEASADWHAFQSDTARPGGEVSVWALIGDANYKCHENCREQECFPVQGQAECLNAAEDAGHRFYSYRRHDGMCSTSDSCDNPIAATKTKGYDNWRSFQTLWSLVKDGDYKCHHSCNEDGCAMVPKQSDCQNRAVVAGHQFYSYRPVDRRCATSSTCHLTASDAGPGWRAYRADLADEEDLTVWALMHDGNYKCHQTCSQDGCTTVANQEACLSNAIAAGHKFYSYRATDRRCTTSSICNQPISARAAGWHAYQVLWEPMSMEGKTFKCFHNGAEDGMAPAASQSECQTRALGAGHHYFSFNPGVKLCVTSSSCDHVTKSWSWKSFQSEEAAAVGRELTIWSRIRNEQGVGGYKCHSKCSTDTCVKVGRKADCLQRAMDAGHSYYSYRATDKTCTTSPTCFTPTLSKDAQWNAMQMMWPRILDGISYKCHHTCREDTCIQVANRGECQQRAVAAGHAFYSYRPTDRKCATSPSCSPPIKSKEDTDHIDARGETWHAFQSLWPLVKQGQMKCHWKCSQNECSVVSSRADCQGVALLAGHEFYSYRASDKMCASSSFCSGQEAKSDWHAYRFAAPGATEARSTIS